MRAGQTDLNMRLKGLKSKKELEWESKSSGKGMGKVTKRKKEMEK